MKPKQSNKDFVNLSLNISMYLRRWWIKKKDMRKRLIRSIDVENKEYLNRMRTHKSWRKYTKDYIIKPQYEIF